MGLKHIGANSVTSVTAYVTFYSSIQVHKLVQIESVLFVLTICLLVSGAQYIRGLRCIHLQGQAVLDSVQ